MFQFLFKYPFGTFTRGQILLLAPWPAWVLWLSIIAASAALAALIAMRLHQSVATMRSWRAGVVWLLQSSLAAVVLLLLWQPAVTVTELKPQQNIVAVVVDDSHSMISEHGSTRQAQAVKVLRDAAGEHCEVRNASVCLDRVTRITDLGAHAAAPDAHRRRIEAA
jgi:hypothetical protein